MGTKVHRPEDVYRTVRNIAPDLLVYFGNLDWRAVGMVGFDSIYTFENDTGPDAVPPPARASIESSTPKSRSAKVKVRVSTTPTLGRSGAASSASRKSSSYM
jgi:predicted AlkP superfamily phosphohydrolase/phosphomutase